MATARKPKKRSVARCVTKLTPQSIIFPAEYGTRAARAWLRKHKKKAPKVDRQANTLRYRQLSPSQCRPGQFATIRMGKTDIKMVMCCVK